MEIANKTTQLVRFQQCVNERVALILKANNYCILDEVTEDDCLEEEVC